jgi:hypothetical protein
MVSTSAKYRLCKNCRVIWSNNKEARICDKCKKSVYLVCLSCGEAVAKTKNKNHSLCKNCNTGIKQHDTFGRCKNSEGKSFETICNSQYLDATNCIGINELVVSGTNYPILSHEEQDEPVKLESQDSSRKRSQNNLLLHSVMTDENSTESHFIGTEALHTRHDVNIVDTVTRNEPASKRIRYSEESCTTPIESSIVNNEHVVQVQALSPNLPTENEVFIKLSFIRPTHGVAMDPVDVYFEVINRHNIYSHMMEPKNWFILFGTNLAQVRFVEMEESYIVVSAKAPSQEPGLKSVQVLALSIHACVRPAKKVFFTYLGESNLRDTSKHMQPVVYPNFMMPTVNIPRSLPPSVETPYRLSNVSAIHGQKVQEAY